MLKERTMHDTVLNLLVILKVAVFSHSILWAQTNQQKALVESIKREHKLNDDQLKKLTEIISRSRVIGQGNPEVTKHPMAREQCQKGFKPSPDSFATICGAKHMAPLYKPGKQKPEQAKVCIDQFEFPNIPCDYPVIWVRASEAQQICQAIGKRLCDAHEWEGACAGSLEEPDYDFDAIKDPKLFDNAKQKKLRSIHNKKRTVTWAYGDKQNHKLCATGSAKSPGCDKALSSGKGVYQNCGSNTYPAGAFPQCKSSLGVYDQHGNAAEHMNLPLSPDEMTINGGTGVVEMKGSWFIFGKISAHKDDCRWRAPYWHGSRLMNKRSHNNYHLGFRCCKDL